MTRRVSNKTSILVNILLLLLMIISNITLSEVELLSCSEKKEIKLFYYSFFSNNAILFTAKGQSGVLHCHCGLS